MIISEQFLEISYQSIVFNTDYLNIYFLILQGILPLLKTLNYAYKRSLVLKKMSTLLLQTKYTLWITKSFIGIKVYKLSA